MRQRGVFHPQMFGRVMGVVNDAMDGTVSIYRVTGQGSFDFTTGQQTGTQKVQWSADPIPARIQKVLRPRHGEIAHNSFDRQEIRIQIPLTTTPPAGEQWQSGLTVEVLSCAKDTGMVGRGYYLMAWEGGSSAVVRTLMCDADEKDS